MTSPHRLTGYDKVTDFLVFAHEIPRVNVPAAQDIAAVPLRDPDAVGVYPLSEEKAKRIARVLGKGVNTDRYDWFFEPMPEPLSGDGG